MPSDWTSENMEVTDTRKQLFSQKSKTLDNIPSNQAALKQHINPLSANSSTLVDQPHKVFPSEFFSSWLSMEAILFTLNVLTWIVLLAT